MARFEADVPCWPAKPVPSNCEVGVVELSIGRPSTTNRGSPVPPSVLAPRMRIEVEAPGSPDVEMTSTLGALAASAVTRLVSLLRAMSEESTLLRTFPSFSTSVSVPAPVTTTSPSWSGFGAREKSRLWSPLTVTSRVCGL